jgi:hypothetical protein
MDVRFRPISTWPGERTPPHKQKDGSKAFAMGWTKTLQSLDRELTHLQARDTVIEADLKENQIRLDGYPRGGEFPKTSGVIVSFTSNHGPLRVPCDYFKRYEHNLRAIALHLERLRLATLYGVGQHGEQYRGWKRLNAPIEAGPVFTVESAAQHLSLQIGAGVGAVDRDYAALIILNLEQYRLAYRSAAALLHPDNSNTGSADKWQLLQEAKAVLDKHHGLAKTQEAR